MISSFYEMYRYRSMFVVAFVSKFYIEKDITMHEAAIFMDILNFCWSTGQIKL